MTLKTVCVPCARFYRPRKNGFPLIESMPKANAAKPGKEHAADWQPYKLWVGDLWECSSCGHQVVQGALHPIAENYHPTFEDYVERLKPTLTVNDC